MANTTVESPAKITAEMNFNLVNFLETLVAMDRQHQAWLKQQAVKIDKNI